MRRVLLFLFLYVCIWCVLYLESIKKFLTEFYTDGDNGKVFAYGLQLTKIAHREQTELVINLDDVAQVSHVSLEVQ